MKYNPQIHHRRSIRLKEYDYSQAGLYFITICTQNRACLFGEIENGEMILNDAGKMIDTEWMHLKKRFPNIQLHAFVIMPNHLHGILEIVSTNVGATLVVAQNENNVVAPVTVSPVDTEPRDGQPQNTGQPQGIAPTGIKTVGDMMDAFKSITTVEYIRGVKQHNWQPFDGKLWQRNYWEHIIRNDDDCNRITQYIINNPKNWGNDTLK